MFPPIQRATCGRPLPPVAGGPDRRLLSSASAELRPGQLHLRWASAASQEGSPTPSLRATPPKRGIRHITGLRSVHSIDGITPSMHSMGFAHASTTQDQGGASTITERSCPYALWAWKNFNTCQLRLRREKHRSPGSDVGITAKKQRRLALSNDIHQSVNNCLQLDVTHHAQRFPKSLHRECPYLSNLHPRCSWHI